MKNTITISKYFLTGLLVAVLFFVGINFVSGAWQPPSGAPTANQPEPPVNTGPVYQDKAGPLSAWKMYADGMAGINRVVAPEFCLTSQVNQDDIDYVASASPGFSQGGSSDPEWDCISSWNLGGTTDPASLATGPTNHTARYNQNNNLQPAGNLINDGNTVIVREQQP